MDMILNDFIFDKIGDEMNGFSCSSPQKWVGRKGRCKFVPPLPKEKERAGSNGEWPAFFR
jgi:hypothetical protein